MQQIPPKARAYIFGMYCLAMGVISLAICFPASKMPGNAAWTIVLFLILAALAGSKKISLTSTANGATSMSMSLGFTVTFAALLYCGPIAGMLTGAVSSVAAGLKGRKQTVDQLLFNTALSLVETYAAGMVFLALGGRELIPHPLEALPALCASCLVFFLINTAGVSIVIALVQDSSPVKVWRNTFSWTAPSYFAGASISTLAVDICGEHVLYFALFLSPVVYMIYQSYATYRARVDEHRAHVEELEKRQVKLADLYLATIKSLALAIDAKDQYTHQHILRVQRYAVAIATEMGMGGDNLEGLKTGALLHDIGKLGVPEYILLKPGQLSEEEFAKIKRHPEIGAAILNPVDFPWPVLPVVKHHHEKWDGGGYPDGLAGEAIPLAARILAVADVYDALTSHRSYRQAWDHDRAIARIREEAGSHFDPDVVDAFERIIDTVIAEMAAENTAELQLHIVSSAATEPVINANMAVRQIQQASSELWTLYEVAQSLSSSLGLQETLDILAKKLEVIAAPGAAYAFLLFDSPEGGELRTRSVTGAGSAFLNGSRTLGEQSISRRVAMESKSYCGPYMKDDLMITAMDISIWPDLRSALIVPIAHEGTVLGTINAYHPEANAFNDHDVDLLQMIAERSAMAIYNGVMFDMTRSDAMTDPLTGLYNFRYLTRIIDEFRQLSEATGEPFSLFCVDLDDFKPINDNFGHQKGDQVLRDLSQLLLATVRATDIVARYGGDEFLILLRNADHVRAKSIARKIRTAVEAYDPGLEHPTIGELRIGASIGWSCSPNDGSDCTTLLAAADAAMYRNKTERKLSRLAGGEKPKLRRAA